MIARFEYFKLLYEHEKFIGLRRCHKLTNAHIHPTNFERMNVAKAAQVFSNSVAMALNHYRDLPETKPKFEGICRQMNTIVIYLSSNHISGNI